MTVDVDKTKCISCAGCVGVCPVTALKMDGENPVCNDKCTNCKICVDFCPVGALKLR